MQAGGQEFDSPHLHQDFFKVHRTLKTKYDISKISILMRLEKDDMIRVFLIVKVKTNKSSKLVENMINSDNSIRSS